MSAGKPTPARTSSLAYVCLLCRDRHKHYAEPSEVAEAPEYGYYGEPKYGACAEPPEIGYYAETPEMGYYAESPEYGEYGEAPEYGGYAESETAPMARIPTDKCPKWSKLSSTPLASSYPETPVGIDRGQ